MGFWMTLLIVAVLGLLGGGTTCFLSGEFVWPHREAARSVLKLGSLATIAVGPIAAVIVWCAYGPASTDDLTKATSKSYPLPVAQVAISFLVGVSGVKILTTMAERDAERTAKIDYAKMLDKMMERL